MPSFSYIARDSGSGREIRSTVDASSEPNAVAALLNRNLMVVSITEKISKKGRTSGGKVALADLVIFTRQLATMIDAGLAMVQSLQALGEQADNKLMRDVIKDITTRVEGGDSFSEALQKHPKVFNRLYYSMVSAGERGGLLAEILSRLATYQENTARLRKKVKSSMMYPTVVTVVALSITIFLLVRVVPTFAEIFKSFGNKVPLPAPTQYLMMLSSALMHYFPIFIIGGGSLIGGWLYYIKTPAGRRFWDDRRIKLPVFGHIAHKICLARFASTFASLVRSGLPILEVLSIVQNTVGNVIMEAAIQSSAADIERGESISTALGKHPIFPSMIIRMMQAGEQTGKLDVMLERVAGFLDEEIETILAGLTSLIEPLLIVFLGVVVGGIVICMFLPIFKLSELVSQKP
jgi:type IV pilus assembly protein PilC